MNPESRSRQRGAVLIVSLMFLVILTMLGVTAMSGTTMEERMAGNTRDAGLALQAAEAALRYARRDISNIPARGTGRTVPLIGSDFGDNAGAAGSCGPTGLCLPGDPNYPKKPPAILPPVPAHNMRDEPSVAYGTFTGAAPLAARGADGTFLSQQPRYIIEAFCLFDPGETISKPACNFYRITAAGFGRNPNSVVTLQEIFISL